MASSLYENIGEVRGEVRWRAVAGPSCMNKFLPGKFILTRLADSFFIQGVYDTGRMSRKYKLDLQQMIKAKIIARDGKFTFHIPLDKGTSFNVQKGIENEIESFLLLLDEIKISVVRKAASKNKDLFGYIAPVPRVKLLIEQVEGPKKPTLAAAVKRHTLPNAVHKTPQKRMSALTEVKQIKVVPRLPPQQEQALPNAVHKTPQKRTSAVTEVKQVKVVPRLPLQQVSERKIIQTTRFQDEREKENIQAFTESPEKKKSPEKRSDIWSTFGTPHNKKPLQENETSPQLSRRNHAKTFYGSNNSSILVKRRNAKKLVIKKSLLDIPSLSTPSPAAKVSLFSMTPSVKRSNFSSPSVFAGEITSQGFQNLGNTCYMNAILQSILGLVPFVQELHNTDILSTVDRSSLYNRMYELYRCKYEDGSSPTKKNALRKLKNSLSTRETNKRFNGNEQNDAHEFMNICFDQMKEEVYKALGEKSEDIASKVCPVIRNFEGSVRTYIRCKGCKDLAIKDQLFNHLSLTIPRSQSPKELSLTKLLGRFFQEEDLERSCDICKSTSAVKYLQIRTLPRVIILHLLRSEYHLGTNEKNSNRIHVDRFLEIGDFCTSDMSGPPPFIPKKMSPLKSHFVENETPSTDEDFVVSKPRRRLDMSAAAADKPSDKKPKKNASASSNSKNLPDWVYAQTKPTLSPWISDSSDDEDLKQAKLASLQEQQTDSSEDEQVRRAKVASLQSQQETSFEKQQISQAKLISSQKQFDNSEDERIERAKIASLEESRTRFTQVNGLKKTNVRRLDAKKEKDLQSGAFLDGKENMTDEELMEVVVNIEQNSSDSDNSPATNISGRTTCNGFKPDKSETVVNNDEISRDITNGFSSQGPSKESRDVSVLAASTQNTARKDSKLNGRVIKDDDIVGTPSKRRKIEQSQVERDLDKEIVVPDDEEQELKRILEMSKTEHDQEALEQSQMEEAIKLSLEAIKDMEVEKPAEQQQAERRKTPSIDVSYRLVSVVSHVGLSASGGHYISDVYEVESDQWTRYDDINAKKIKEYVVRYDKLSDGYIYFYMHRGCIDLLKQKAKESQGKLSP